MFSDASFLIGTSRYVLVDTNTLIRFLQRAVQSHNHLYSFGDDDLRCSYCGRRHCYRSATTAIPTALVERKTVFLLHLSSSLVVTFSLIADLIYSCSYSCYYSDCHRFDADDDESYDSSSGCVLESNAMARRRLTSISISISTSTST